MEENKDQGELKVTEARIIKDRSVVRCKQQARSGKPEGEGEKKKNEGVHVLFLQLSPFIGVFAPRREPNFEKKLVALLECVDRNDQAGETGREISRGFASR